MLTPICLSLTPNMVYLTADKDEYENKGHTLFHLAFFSMLGFFLFL